LIVFNDVLKFWFEELEPKQWWVKDQTLDQVITDRFSDLHRRACRGELYTWRSDARGRLAEIIILDQFSRNMFRGSPLSFACDPQALALAQEAVAAGAAGLLTQMERNFLYMPYMHSESPLIHEIALELFRNNGLHGSYKTRSGTRRSLTGSAVIRTATPCSAGHRRRQRSSFSGSPVQGSECRTPGADSCPDEFRRVNLFHGAYQ
jgi:uncharacterized protein (DUF924 family)